MSFTMSVFVYISFSVIKLHYVLDLLWSRSVENTLISRRLICVHIDLVISECLCVCEGHLVSPRAVRGRRVMKRRVGL